MPSPGAIDSAVARAVRCLADSAEPHALLWLEQIGRRFGIEAFAGSLQRFDRLLAGGPRDAPLLRLLRRIADPGNPLRHADLDAVEHTSDRIIIAALYCDRVELPPPFVRALEEAAKSGGYWCTHALLAWIWMQERGGAPELSPRFLDELFAANAAIVNENPKLVTDLKLEAAAFLHEAGQGERVDPAFIDCVLRTQNADGGWGITRDQPDASDWHGSVLGLLLLLHRRRPAGV